MIILAEIIKATNLQKYFGKKHIIKGINLNIEKGDIYGFLGPNGAGKTTTIRMLLGLIKKNEGEIFINGYNLDKDFKKAVDKVGAVVETPMFYENYSGYDNLKLMANLYNNVSKNRIYDLVEMVGLTNRINDKIRKYSLGMKQRLGIARALLNKPELVLLDEPTNGLDPHGMKEIRDLIIKLVDTEKITIFISSHILYEVELLCNRVAIIKNGNKLIEGNVKDLLSENNETVELITEDKNIENIVKMYDYIEGIELIKNGYKIELTKGNTSHLLKELINKNINVQYMIPKSKSLENYFLELTTGDDQIA